MRCACGGAMQAGGRTCAVCRQYRQAAPALPSSHPPITAIDAGIMSRLLPSLLFFIFLLGTPLAAQAQALQLDPVESIVAVVEEDVILRSELDLAVNNVTRRLAGR